MRTLLLLLLCLTAACADPESASQRFCRQLVSEPGAPPTDLNALSGILAEVRAALYPELEGVSIQLEPMDSTSDFFVANLDFATLDDPPLSRRYLVRYSKRLFDDPPGHAATAAVLAHELRHIVDYTGMDGAELAEFALWYVSSDVSAYERETDEHVLKLGCGEALKRYRLWLYGQVDPATLEQKKKDYYTPQEIDAWIAEHG